MFSSESNRVWRESKPYCRHSGAGPECAGTGASTVKKVTIHDNYYDPLKLRVKVGTTVKWVWPNDVGDTHDVNLAKRPKGVTRVMSRGMKKPAK